MTTIQRGRLTVDNQDGLVVFLLGARVNKIWLLPFSLPILSKNEAMLRELSADPDSGLLGYERFGMSLTVQYWRSLEHLVAYANDEKKQHRPTWRRFFQRIFDNEAVGIWHETFVLQPANYESIYTNMPPIGLGRIKPLVPAEGARSSALHRLKERSSVEQSRKERA